MVARKKSPIKRTLRVQKRVRKDHSLYVQPIKDAKKENKALEDQVKQLEIRLAMMFQNVRDLEEALEARSETHSEELSELNEEHGRRIKAWEKEKLALEKHVEDLQKEVVHERRRSTQALDVAERTSNATYSLGRIFHQLVDENVLEQFRLANHERKEQARERVHHRRQG